VTPGRIIANKYRIVRVLGRGGMGVVAEAEHIVLGNRVAIKFLREDVSDSIAPDARFTREAKLAARLTSRHACRVQDFGTWELGPYLVMELLEGQSLAASIQTRGRIPWQDTVQIALEICDALGEAHALGIVHRDLKPGNIFLTNCREAGFCTKVLDFGVAKIPAAVVTQSGGPSLTDGSTLIGTPAYVAPEQLMNSKLVDAAADVWAMGVVLYEMLSGRLPFQSPWVPKLLVMIAREQPTPITELCPDCPKALAEIVMRCLEKKPAARFPHAADLGLCLTRLLPASEEALGRLTTFSLPHPGPASNPPRPSPNVPSTPPIPLIVHSLEPHTTAIRQIAPPTNRRAGWGGAGLGLVAGTVVTVGALGLMRFYTDSSRRPAASGVELGPRTVDLRLSAQPPSARIELDGQLLPDNPHRGAYPSDSRNHQIRVSADGYASHVLTVTLDRDLSLAVPLSRLPAPEPRALATSSPTRVSAGGPRRPDSAPSKPPEQSQALVPRTPAKLDAKNPFGD
jgi:eukaryotic-like serine/threonine-protein kinase